MLNLQHEILWCVQRSLKLTVILDFAHHNEDKTSLRKESKILENGYHDYNFQDK